MKLTFKHALAAILLMLSFAAPAAAGPFEDAGAAYDKGAYAMGIGSWRMHVVYSRQEPRGSCFDAWRSRQIYGSGCPGDGADVAFEHLVQIIDDGLGRSDPPTRRMQDQIQPNVATPS